MSFASRLSFILLLGFAGLSAQAADIVICIPCLTTTFNVNSEADAVDAIPGDGTCATSTGTCTLRAAIMEANTVTTQFMVINLPDAGPYTLTLAGTGETASATGDLNIKRTMTINGNQFVNSIVEAGSTQVNGVDRVFSIEAAQTAFAVTFNNLTIRHGKVTGSIRGGGISAQQDMTLNNCIVQDNGGSGIYNVGPASLTVNNSIVQNNNSDRAGGIDVNGGSATLLNSGVIGNAVGLDGGGILLHGNATLTMTGSSVNGNSGNNGAGIAVGDGTAGDTSSASLTNCTLSGNLGTPLTTRTSTNTASLMNVTSSANNSGIRADGAVTLQNTILAEKNSNCSGTHFSSSGHNLSSDLTCQTYFVAAGDGNGNNPALVGPGYSTIAPYYSLSPTSLAVDAGSGCPSVDQRGVARPKGAACDVGSYEYWPPASVDFTADHKSDVILQNSSTGAIAEWQMNGNTIAAGAVIANPTLAWTVRMTGDTNFDFKADIFLQSAAGDVAEWEMNGNAILNGAVIGSPGSNWVPVVTGDFNGDGEADVILQNSSTGDVAEWGMFGLTIVRGGVISSPGTAWHVVAAGDFNGDHMSDLVLQNSATGDVAVWQMNQLLITAGAIISSPGTSWKVVAAGDFDGDGKSDLILQNSSTGDVAEWRMNGMTITGGAVISSPGTAWTVLGTSDYNGDGKSDVLLRNTAGDLAEWQIDGYAITAGAVISTPGTAWVPIVR